MTQVCFIFIVFHSILYIAVGRRSNINTGNKIFETTKCKFDCPPGDHRMACGFDAETRTFTLFPSNCDMMGYANCHNIGYINQSISFCIKDQVKQGRRFYGESCPVFCPTHYRPICAASKLRSYKYRTFTNACHFDMLNCRGDEDDGYVEVGLEFCQRHAMKNIFKEQIIVSRFDDYRDYQDY